MDYNDFVEFMWQNSLFSFSVILVSFILGWILYDKIIARKINLKEALFDKDNFAAWIEFIGAFIFPVFYLASKAVTGSESTDIWVDFGISVVYVIAYVVLMTILRLMSGVVVRLIGSEDSEGKVQLNNEIYGQKNISAALFSVSLSVIFASLISLIDILPEYFLSSVFKFFVVLVYTLIASVVYILFIRRRTTLFKEIFIDNNSAAGVSLLGYIIAVELLLLNSMTYNPEYNFTLTAIMAGLCLILFGVITFLFKMIFSKVIGVDFMKEIYEDNNVGAAIGQMALYIGVANMIIGFIK